MTRFFLFIVLMYVVPLRAQEFTLQDYLHMIARNHPAVKQAALLNESADAQLREARGAFDPYIATEAAQKEYAEKLYYRQWNTELYIPVYSGIDLYAGYTQNSGVYLDPSETDPENGLYKAGVRVDVLQGLLTNRRQTDLAQAKVLQDMNANMQQQILNTIYFEAIKDYLNWSRSWEILQLYQSFIEQAQKRYTATVSLYQLGDIPAIDTLEAFIQLQDRQSTYNESFIQYVYAINKVNAYLWSDNLQPIRLKEDQVPQKLEALPLLQDSVQSINWLTHPDVLDYTFTIQTLDLERKLKTQYLLPKLSISYNVLSPTLQMQTDALDVGNYQYGLTFKYPLFLRAERGALQQTKIKLQDTELKQMQKLNSLQLKASVLEQEITVQDEQRRLMSNMRTQTNTLLDAEEIKFEMGESSLFLVNSRELSYITTSVKYFQIEYKFREAVLQQLYNSGRIASVVATM